MTAATFRVVFREIEHDGDLAEAMDEARACPLVGRLAVVERMDESALVEITPARPCRAVELLTALRAAGCLV